MSAVDATSMDEKAVGLDEKAVGLDELAGLCDAREATYGLLARIFEREADASLIAELRGMRMPVADGVLGKGWQSVATWLARADETCALSLARDFAGTFIGQGNTASSAAYPYESVYTSPGRLLMQDARDEVLALYRAEGVDKAEACHETEDHVALELEFLGTLAARTAKACRAGDEDEAARLLSVSHGFVEDHLGRWAGAFAADVRRFAKTGFYQGWADILEGFVQADSTFLREALGE